MKKDSIQNNTVQFQEQLNPSLLSNKLKEDEVVLTKTENQDTNLSSKSNLFKKENRVLPQTTTIHPRETKENESTDIVHLENVYCVNAAYRPCTDKQSTLINSRICNEYLNYDGVSVCNSNDDCVIGRTCREPKKDGKKLCEGNTTLEFKLCELTEPTLKVNEIGYEICNGDTNLRPCTGNRVGKFLICNEFLNLQGPSTCNSARDCNPGRLCSGSDSSAGVCYPHSRPFVLYKDCQLKKRQTEKTTVYDNGLTRKFDLCNQKTLKACSTKETNTFDENQVLKYNFQESRSEIEMKYGVC